MEEKKSEETIKKDMPIGDVVTKHPETIEVFLKHGLHCIGCHVAAYESLEEGAKAHGIDAKKLLEDLNKAIKKKK